MPKTVHRTTVRVLYGDTDAGGVVYNANFLRYFEVGRTELMRESVCSYLAIEKMGFILPVTECWTRYKAPAFYDDLLTIVVQIPNPLNLDWPIRVKEQRMINRGKQYSCKFELSHLPTCPMATPVCHSPCDIAALACGAGFIYPRNVVGQPDT